jgi:hypothetical protein
MNEKWHGTANGYDYHACRCDRCKRAMMEYRKEYAQRLQAKGKADPSLIPHGTMHGYTNWGCRCDECKATALARKHRIVQTNSERNFTHGYNGYNNYGCRCDECRAANVAQNRKLRERRRANAKPEDIPHGTYSGYANLSCRCDECKEAACIQSRNAKAKRRLKA